MVVRSAIHGPHIPQDSHPEGDHCIHPLPMEQGWSRCCHCGKSDTTATFLAADVNPLPVEPEPVVEPAGGIVLPAEDAL